MCNSSRVRVCRACLTAGDCTFFELKHNIRYFHDFLKIEIDRSSINWLCYSCNYRITKTLDFADKVHKANAFFQHVLNVDKIRENVELNRLLMLNHNMIGFPELSRKDKLNDEIHLSHWDDELQLEIPTIKIEIFSPHKTENLSDLEPDANDNFEEDFPRSADGLFDQEQGQENSYSNTAGENIAHMTTDKIEEEGSQNKNITLKLCREEQIRELENLSSREEYTGNASKRELQCPHLDHIEIPTIKIEICSPHKTENLSYLEPDANDSFEQDFPKSTDGLFDQEQGQENSHSDTVNESDVHMTTDKIEDGSQNKNIMLRLCREEQIREFENLSSREEYMGDASKCELQYPHFEHVEMDEENQIDDQLKRKREMTNARVKKYRKKKRTESELLNSSMKDDPTEEMRNKQIKENNAKRKRAMAKERSRRYREKKRLNFLNSDHHVVHD